MILSKTELKTLCEVAKTAAIEAGEYIQSQVYKHHVTLSKEGGSSIASQVVTEVDIKAQEIILGHLQSTIKIYDLGLLTEEAIDDHSRTEKNYFWCVDPMDGTLAFTERRSGYAVSIALISKAGDPVIGVVYVPDLAACYSCVKGNGVELNEKPFIRDTRLGDNRLHVYLDRSFQSEDYFQLVQTHINEVVIRHQAEKTENHTSFGAVRNALGVMTSQKGCYFKFPKKPKGGGCIWDYAATMLFFEELGMWVSNAKGRKLDLNNPQTAYMNNDGILYATDASVAEDIIALGKKVLASLEK